FVLGDTAPTPSMGNISFQKNNRSPQMVEPPRTAESRKDRVVEFGTLNSFSICDTSSSPNAEGLYMSVSEPNSPSQMSGFNSNDSLVPFGASNAFILRPPPAPTGTHTINSDGAHMYPSMPNQTGLSSALNGLANSSGGRENARASETTTAVQAEDDITDNHLHLRFEPSNNLSLHSVPALQGVQHTHNADEQVTLTDLSSVAVAAPLGENDAQNNDRPAASSRHGGTHPDGSPIHFGPLTGFSLPSQPGILSGESTDGNRQARASKCIADTNANGSPQTQKVLEFGALNHFAIN
ncbi:hypothetical protein BDW22DRAFT_1349565, partial [Trametopsis cervina]